MFNPQANKAGGASTRERRNRESLKRLSLQAEIAAILRMVSEREYGGGSFPQRDGGLIFRTLASRFEVPETVIADLARKAGLWPWSFQNIVTECRIPESGLVQDEVRTV